MPPVVLLSFVFLQYCLQKLLVITHIGLNNFQKHRWKRSWKSVILFDWEVGTLTNT